MIHGDRQTSVGSIYNTNYHSLGFNLSLKAKISDLGLGFEACGLDLVV